MSKIVGFNSWGKKTEQGGDPDNTNYVGSGTALYRTPVEQQSSEPLPPGSHIVTMYEDGFTIDMGPFRPLSEPQNEAFAESILGGFVPDDPLFEGQDAPHIALVDRRTAKFNAATHTVSGAPVREESPVVPSEPVRFQGTGNVLSAPSAVQANGTANPNATVAVDRSQPIVSFRLMLSNGQRRLVEMNASATVGQLRAHVSVLTGQSGFRLVSGMPPKDLTDDSITLKAANVDGEVVTQRA